MSDFYINNTNVKPSDILGAIKKSNNQKMSKCDEQNLQVSIYLRAFVTAIARSNCLGRDY